jgi:hypothetical protein
VLLLLDQALLSLAVKNGWQLLATLPIIVQVPS